MEKAGKKLQSSSSSGGKLPSAGEAPRVRSSNKGPRISTTLLSSSVDTNPIELMYLDQDVLQEGLKHSTQLMQQHREEGNARRQRHEQRRRKFLRQLDTTQMNFSNKVFEKEVIGQILNYARCEEEEKEFKDEVLSYKEIMVYNRHNRDKKIQELHDRDHTHDSLWESVEAQREIDWVVKLDTKSQLHRRATLLNATKSANRDEAMSMVNDFISKLLDQVDWTLTCREVGGFGADFVDGQNRDPSQEPLPSLLWKDASTMLTANLPFLEPLPNLEPFLPSSALLPFSISEAPHLASEQWLLQGTFKSKSILDRKDSGEEGLMTSSDFLAKEDWLSFLSNLNSKSAVKFLENHKIESTPADEKVYTKDELRTPAWLKSTQSPYFLGEAVVEVRCRVDPLPAEPETVLDTSSFPIRAVLFGVSDRMREMTVAAAKALIPRLNIISVEALVKNVFSFYDMENKDLESDYGRIAQEVFDSLGCGAGITDKLYVKLIIHELKSLGQAKNNGFLINDFPNSKEQLLLLMEGLSNIRYDQHRPQRSDKSSLLAPLPPDTPELLFDVNKCGLDVVLCVDAMYGGSVDSLMEGSNIDRPLRERVRARRNLVNQEIVFVSADTASVANLQKVYDPKRPMMTCGLDLTIAEQNTQDILAFADALGIADTMELLSASDIDEVIRSKVQSLIEKFVPEEQREEQFWIDYDIAEEEKIRIKKEEEDKAAIALQEAELEAARLALEGVSVQEPSVDAPADAEQSPPAEAALETTENAAPEAKVFPLMTFDKNPPVVEDNVLPIRLAEAMSTFWEKNETFSYQNGHDFFNSMRDIRYQFVQRRRIALDSIYTGLIRVDDRQELFNKFREEFNAIDDELRFDPDCIAELHLRTMMLRNRWSVTSEQRLKELKDLIQTISLDGNVSVLQYNGRYESAYFLQSELNRFFHSLQIIFDYAKSIQGFQCCEKIRNELEVLLPISAYEEMENEAGGKGKDKGKEKDKKPAGKDKGGNSFQSYREPFAPYFMVNTQAILTQIPAGKNPVEEVVDPKAKAKGGKDKKGGDDGTPTDFFAAIETVVLEEVSKWKEGNFSIPRELHYNRDEQLCKSIEAAVWYEADKLALACEMIKSELTAQNSWLETSEQSLITLLNSIADDRYYRELAAGEGLMLVIERCIMNSQPLEELWIMSADATPLVDPLTAWDRLKFCITPEIQSMMDRERQDGDRKKDKPGMKKGNKTSSGSNRRKQGDNEQASGDKVGRNPTRGRRDESAKVRSSLGVSYAAARPSSGSSSGPSNPTSARPRSAQDSSQNAESKARELYLKQKIELEAKFQKKRAKREEEYRQMGMSQAAAVLAAHHELFLEEQHQMEDFEAKFRTKRPSSSRNSSAKRRDGKK